MKKLEIILTDQMPSDEGKTVLALAIRGMSEGEYCTFGENHICHSDTFNWCVVLPVIVDDMEEIKLGDYFLPDDIRPFEKAEYIDKDKNILNGYHLPSCRKVIKFPEDFDQYALDLIIGNNIKTINAFLSKI